MEKSLVEMKENQPTIDEGYMYKVVTIEPSKGRGPQNVILEKPTVEMTKMHSMSNLQGEQHQRLIIRKCLMQYISLPCGRCWASPRRIRSTLQPLMLGKLFYSMF